MNFESPLVFGTLVRRYKRFLADVELADGRILTAVCPNTGSMRSCATPGWRVGLSHSASPTRKYAYTWELVHNGACWIGINTGRTNGLVCEAIEQGLLPELAGYATRQREQAYGRSSRIDILMSDGARRCYVEVKNVSLRTDDGAAAFPDAVTARGLKHLEELARMVREGHRAVMCYVVQRADCTGFRLAAEIDAAYAKGFAKARRAGVEAVVYAADVSPEGIVLGRRMEMQGGASESTPS
ncbi:MAG: DNA/RNA nuclease SfsA [Lentisphaerae bacterium]|nr:DNA/RNA nuclease SfsA [Lentisphaerota bacterium]